MLKFPPLIVTVPTSWNMLVLGETACDGDGVVSEVDDCVDRRDFRRAKMANNLWRKFMFVGSFPRAKRVIL